MTSAPLTSLADRAAAGSLATEAVLAGVGAPFHHETAPIPQGAAPGSPTAVVVDAAAAPPALAETSTQLAEAPPLLDASPSPAEGAPALGSDPPDASRDVSSAPLAAASGDCDRMQLLE